MVCLNDLLEGASERVHSGCDVLFFGLIEHQRHLSMWLTNMHVIGQICPRSMADALQLLQDVIGDGLLEQEAKTESTILGTR